MPVKPSAKKKTLQRHSDILDYFPDESIIVPKIHFCCYPSNLSLYILILFSKQNSSLSL